MHLTVTYLDSADYQNDQRVGYQRTLYDPYKSRRSVDVPGEMPLKDRKRWLFACTRHPPMLTFAKYIYQVSLPVCLARGILTSIHPYALV